MSRRGAIVDRLCDGVLLMYFAMLALVALVPVALFVAALEVADGIDAVVAAWKRRFR